ncbi:MAG: Hpt domain-containing protein [Acetobacteraceae bacterium]|nr:Hpt domain-containing protein [Acetobacteraceae bacterium]
MAKGPVKGSGAASPGDAPAFDPVEFAELAGVIGEDAVLDLVWIFETETTDRLQRLVAGGQDKVTLVREMHTLKGAAGIVASPRLTALGQCLEQMALRGIAPASCDLKAIEDALRVYLEAVRIRTG